LSTIQIRNANTFALIRTLRGHRLRTTALAFDPQGRHLVSGGVDSFIRFWRLSDGAEVAAYSEETGNEWATFGSGVPSIVFPPDGRRFYYGREDAGVVAARHPFPN
jgi:WD40 repeat protein